METNFKGLQNGNKIVESFRSCTVTDQANWKHENGSIFEVGGILSKLNNNGDQFFAIDGKWVPAFE